MTEAEHKNETWAAVLPTAALLLLLSSWGGLSAALAYGLWHLYPAVRGGDPASILVFTLLAAQLLFLLQALFYLPPREPRLPLVLRCRLFRYPLAFLLLPRRPLLETGQALEAAAGAEDRRAILAAVRSRLRCSPLLSLPFLLEARSPLDCVLNRLALLFGAGPGRFFRFIHLLAAPARQFSRLWGYWFFLLNRKFGDPGPRDELSVYKCSLAQDLAFRAEALSPGSSSLESLILIRQTLASVFDDPEYGRSLGGDLPELPGRGQGPFYKAPFLVPRYRGAYLDWPATTGVRRPEEMYDRGGPADPSLFYPPELAREMEELAWLSAEKKRLGALLERREGYMIVDERPTLSWELAGRIEDLEARIQRLRRRLAAHNRRCRSAHLALAEKAGQGWPELLRSLGALLYLAEQGRATLDLALEDYAQNLDYQEPLSQAAGLYLILRDTHHRLRSLPLSGEMEFRPAGFGTDLNLRPPEPSGLEGWLEDWGNSAAALAGCLADLKDKALSALLAAEDRLAEEIKKTAPGPAVGPLVPPADELDLFFRNGPEPEPQTAARIHSAAEGLKTGFGRGLASVLLLALLIWQAVSLGQTRLTVYNGLGRQIQVTVDGRELELPPYDFKSLELRPDRLIKVLSRAGEREVESFEQQLFPHPAQEVYNIAGAAPLQQWVSPPTSQGETALFLGRPRWLLSAAEFIFQEPPFRENSRPRLVLSAYGQAPPGEILAAFDDEKDRAELIALHARWDEAASLWFWQWQVLLMTQPDFAEILAERFRAEPGFLLFNSE